ncbi:hypothetical protein EIP91_001354 [Steccherinum ochraceum]|uniref:Blue (type 1) copper domain-containing protein n=1 Tax=Steccherinum ochraceum TaxID=92696 RepID=A0A4R0RUV9_9APHY|nr:hypothetical protein EIP91_001354 [Steccherinum ochraceum]
MFKFAVTLSLLPLLVAGQYNYPPPAPAPAQSSPAAAAAAPSAPASSSTQVNIDVGAGGNFIFKPANVTAANGTLVTFFFPDGAIPHSVTQSSFADPCTPLASGFDSGLQNSKQFTINITNDATPIWFFCKAPTHCGTGMVGSINAPATGNTFDNFQAAAVKIGANEVTIQDSGFASGGVGALATASPAATVSASPSTSSGSSPSGGSGSDATTLVVSSSMGLVALLAGLTLFA